MIDADALHSFVLFAELRNFTHAARELNISQPALHVKIRKLSEALGVALYVRRGRALELTRAGREVARFGREMRMTVHAFVAGLHGDAVNEPVVLAAGEGALLYLLAPAIRAWPATASPLRILTRDREGTLEALRAGEAQLGVATLDVLPADLAAIPLMRAEQVVVLPSRHRLTRKPAIELRDLEGAALIVPPAGRAHREAIGRAMLDAGVSWHVAVEATGWPLMLELAKLGIGLAIVNRTCIVPRGLTTRPLRGLPATHYYAIHRRGKTTDGSRRLLKLIRDAARKR